MSERVGTRSREPEPSAFPKYFSLITEREQFVELQQTAPLVIKAVKPDQFELCPQGLIGWYLQPHDSSNACLQDWWVFIHDIRGVSGRHRHQGGLVLFIIEGRGYSTMNGVRYDWEEGDMVIMPLLREGVEHQHFNLRTDGSSKWLAFIHQPTWNEQGSELVQSALDPEFVEHFGVTSWKGATTAVEKLVPKSESEAGKGGGNDNRK